MARLVLIFLAACSGAYATGQGPTPGLETRFIPMQLVVPGTWDGSHRIDMPIAEGGDSEGPARWTGAIPTPARCTGFMTAVVRTRAREPSNKRWLCGPMAPPSAASTIRASRGLFCDQEAKFPLGVWQQGEVRTFDYTCRATRGGQVVERRRTARITIEDLDYVHDGVPHSLRFAWWFADWDSGDIIDHRTYILSPGRGLVAQMRR